MIEAVNTLGRFYDVFWDQYESVLLEMNIGLVV